MTKHRKVALALLGAALGLIALALLVTVHVPKGGAHHVWPVTSSYILPLMAMICGYAFLGAFLLSVFEWLIKGEQQDD